MYNCPQCGFEIDNEEICPRCGFDINTTLSCPYKISKRCVHSGTSCNVYGLNYEDCNTYLHKAGII